MSQGQLKLHQVIALEGGIKSRVNAFASDAYKIFQKTSIFVGILRVYQKKEEDGEQLPSEGLKVQHNAEQLLRATWTQTAELFDIVATKDNANRFAKADLIVDGVTLLKDAPAVYLLFLEKQFKDIRAEIVKVPELDPTHDWIWDENGGYYRTKVFQTARSRKVQEPLVLAPATDKHPAQTQLITRDVLAGYWDTVHLSGAMPAERKRALLMRIDRLSDALRVARESANEEVAEKKAVAKPIFEYLLA